MSVDTRLMRIEQGLQQLWRLTQGGAVRTANPQGAPAVRLAKIAEAVTPDAGTDPSTAPIVWVYKIQFVDGTFTESVSVQTLDTDVRAATYYYAATEHDTKLSVGDIVLVHWMNGRWWIAGRNGPSLVNGTAGDFYDTGVAPLSWPASPMFDADDASSAVSVNLFDGYYFDNHPYTLLKVSGAYYAPWPSDVLVGVADADGNEGDSIAISVWYDGADTGENITAKVWGVDSVSTGDKVVALIVDGLKHDGAGIFSSWICFRGGAGGGGGGQAITATADDFYDADVDATGTFTNADGTFTATISRGLCLDGKDYGLIWADDDHWAVIDPEMEAVVVPTALQKFGGNSTATVYAGATKGSEATTSNTISAWVRKGLVFSGKTYRARWLDRGWEIEDPSLEFVAQAAADIDIGDTVGTQLIFTGSAGSETSSGTSTSVYNRYGNILSGAWVRCQWLDSAGTFEFVNAVCNP